MNERIKELVKKAGGKVSTQHLMSNPVQHRESIELWDDKIEKFAELIVRECADRGSKAMYPDFDPDYVGRKIREHFGVE